ncbi:Rrt5p KNAG_0L01180 [Huiozyma naganishii CBS 8797]|uniref:RRM domain-containing protein n=1 Tax=Huiozyma naganishii (strain ATCC MYA-139 / BCRC 22969 / CBS 8797 / KCTC 17520 / NBRC 10181 / NCYC 3082 / Yp74L-3) TaxID=1071383 RepID=J7RS63_HUIN7|nr:hypothetical protein KNAG_0L01180 [Kazachstania naganishii CBS 8797]CCK72738.1 hypothetical protein KNAG_0L01180 [Kazachstania naganishii CBS 8797]
MLRFRSNVVPKEPVKESNRVFVDNLHYYTGEQEFYEFLKDYGAKSVFIPYEMNWSFRNEYPRSLGFAVAECEDVEVARALIATLQDFQYKGRSLKLAWHVPFVPKGKWATPKDKKQIGAPVEPVLEVSQSPVNDNSISTTLSGADVADGSNEGNKRKNKPKKNEKSRRGRYYIRRNKLADDTLYAHILPEGTEDPNLREFFKGFGPTEIWVFQRYEKRHCLPYPKGPFISALVTLPDYKGKLDEAIEQLREKELFGEKVVFKPATISKLEEVKRIAKKEALEKEGRRLLAQCQAEEEVAQVTDVAVSGEMPETGADLVEPVRNGGTDHSVQEVGTQQANEGMPTQTVKPIEETMKAEVANSPIQVAGTTRPDRAFHQDIQRPDY